MSRFNVILLFAVLALVAATPAFSADPPPRTTGPQDDIDPATGFARTTVVRPLLDAAPVPSAAMRPAGSEVFKPHIALILPIASPTLGRVADAVRQGFVAAAEAAGARGPPVNLINVSDDGAAVLEACRRAHSQGALMIVAGLTRDGATAVARSDCPRIPVLTLNQPQDPDPPQQLYSISLSLEHDARQAALLAVADGWHSAILISAPTALARRVQEAFEREWTRAAGEIRGRLAFAGTPEEAQVIRDRIANMRGDMVFMALDQAEARAVRPYVSGMLPVYATSMSVDPRAEAIVNVDLQGVRYVEMPWFVQPDHPAVMVYAVPRTPMSVEQERLYALGIDAYRLAVAIAQSDTKRIALDGVTGRIVLEGQQFARTLTPSEVDSGRVVPLKHP